MDLLPASVTDRYEIVEDRHAIALLKYVFPKEFQDIIDCLDALEISNSMVLAGGGSESDIPKSVGRFMASRGWEKERNLHVSFLADGETVNADTHKIDYCSSKVAFDMEWNSKDQTFDRDLFAFRTFFDFRQVDVAVLLTRSTSLQQRFKSLGIGNKYGASTTHMNKLIPRLNAGRNGGCPIVAFGITERCFV